MTSSEKGAVSSLSKEEKDKAATLAQDIRREDKSDNEDVKKEKVRVSIG